MTEELFDTSEWHPCPCRNTCCDKPLVNHTESYSECDNCRQGCNCND